MKGHQYRDAKITSGWQITICEKLGLKDGDNIIFANAAKVAFSNMQKAFEGKQKS
jgi:hypothetical protein